MNPSLELIRLEENFAYGTFGVLKINKQIFCVTLEPADLLNKTNVSSIPCQQYECKLITSPRYGKTFEICNVPGRTDVLFHAGNMKKHTKGCILLAEKFGKLTGDRAVLNSGNTFKNFMSLLSKYNQLTLTIKEEY